MKDNELQMMMQKIEKEFAERHKNKVHLAANATGNGTNSTVNETLAKQKAEEAKQERNRLLALEQEYAERILGSFNGTKHNLSYGVNLTHKLQCVANFYAMIK
jgi:hypothetical protein